MHGQQHYAFTPHFHPDRSAFAAQQGRDKLKADAIVAAGYTLVTVSHKQATTLTAVDPKKLILQAIKDSH